MGRREGSSHSTMLTDKRGRSGRVERLLFCEDWFRQESSVDAKSRFVSLMGIKFFNGPKESLRYKCLSTIRLLIARGKLVPM